MRRPFRSSCASIARAPLKKPTQSNLDVVLGRWWAALEQFCRDPISKSVSPFNHFIEPSPDQLLRVALVAFKRARLKYVYSILRGKDLKPKNLVMSAGAAIWITKGCPAAVTQSAILARFHELYSSSRFSQQQMMGSQNNLLFSYILYLIGRTEYKARVWPSAYDCPLVFYVRGYRSFRVRLSQQWNLICLFARCWHSRGFIRKLSQICEITLTNDFWAVSLPNDLATSSPRSPSLFVSCHWSFGCTGTFSKIKLADLLDPSMHANRSAVERHHLFPKASWLSKVLLAYVILIRLLITYVEWGDNVDISDQAPRITCLVWKNGLANGFERMYRLHALPENWEKLVDDFGKRRELMAQVIADGYTTLIAEKSRKRWIAGIRTLKDCFERWIWDSG